MKIYRHNFKSHSLKALYLLLLNLIVLHMQAGWENPYTDRVVPYVPNANSQEFQIGDKVDVDEDFFFSTVYPSATSDYLYKNIVSKIILGVDKDFSSAYTSPYKPNTAYTLVVQLEIDYKEWNGSSLITHNNVSKKLRITYDTERGIIENEQNILTLENAVDIEATIISIKNDAGSNITVPDNVYLEGFIQVERYTDLGASSPGLSFTTTPLAANTESRLITISSQPDGTENIDLEWLYLDWESGKPGTAGIRYFEYDFRHDATRVNIKSGTYTLPAIYAKGVIIMRVRANGFEIANMDAWLNGPWSVATVDEQGILKYDSASGITNKTSGNAIKGFKIEGFANGYNWQHATAFAEEGKRKQVISYFDGALYNRQTLTRNTTDNTVIVAQTVYDFNGRPAINVLPVPVPSTNSNDHTLLFKPDFNKSNASNQQYDYTDFDLDVPDNCSVTETNRMKNTSGAEKYYSSSNPYTDKNTDYIPTSFGYPFTQVEYTADNTGRIRRQSGVGPEHRLTGLDDQSNTKVGKETRYYYLKPKQEELDRLFGNEVGNADHYKKNVVIDANGQASVSYLDPMGRVIATALAGDNPEFAPGILSLPSQAGSSNSFKVNLLEGTTTDVMQSNGNAPEFYKSWDQVELNDNTLYKLNYIFAVPRYYAGECYEACYDCRYTLTVSIKNSCGEEMLPTELQEVEVGLDDKPLEDVNDCADSLRFISGESPVSFYLDKGEYRIERTLSMKNAAVESFADHYVANNTCLKTFDELVEEEKEKLNYNHCDYTCEQCSTEVEAANDNDEYDSPEAYEAALLACQQYCKLPSPCDVLMMQMKMDMSPGGQYFSNITPPSTGNDMNFGEIEEGDYSWMNNPANVTSTALDDFNLAHGTDFADWEAMDKAWKDEYAEALVIYHPEYCMWQACNAISYSYAYDELLNGTEDHADALSKGYYNPLKMSSETPEFPIVSGGEDPFFDAGVGASYKSGMMDDMDAYTSYLLIDYSMWDIVGKTLEELGSTDGCLSDYGWKTFRALYLAKKQESLKSYYDAYAVSNSCPSVAGGYQKRFYYDPSEVLATPATPNDAKTNAQSEILSACSTTCESYRDKWEMELSGCDLDVTEMENVLDDLTDVCIAGCDEKNPFGSRNFPDGLMSPPEYANFREVLKGHEKYEKGICDDLHITWPMEYNHDYFAASSAYADTCACNQDKGLYREAEACEEEEAPEVSEDCACEIEDDSKRQAALMALDVPEAQKCVNCIDCYQLNEGLFAYTQLYPYDADALALMSDEDAEAWIHAWQKRLTVFMNLRFKFNLTLEDYMLHATQCQGRDEDLSSLKDIVDFAAHDLITRKNHSYKIAKKDGESEVSIMREFKPETPFFMQEKSWYAQTDNSQKTYLPVSPSQKDLERKTLFTYLEAGRGPNGIGYQPDKLSATSAVAACECSKILNMKYAVDKGFIHATSSQRAYEEYYGLDTNYNNFNNMLQECCDWYARTKASMTGYPPAYLTDCTLTEPIDPNLTSTNFNTALLTPSPAYPILKAYYTNPSTPEICSDENMDGCMYEPVYLDLCGCDKLKKALDNSGHSFDDVMANTGDANDMFDELNDLFGNSVDFTGSLTILDMRTALSKCLDVYKFQDQGEDIYGNYPDDFNAPNPLAPPYIIWSEAYLSGNQLYNDAENENIMIPRILSCSPICPPPPEEHVYNDPCLSCPQYDPCPNGPCPLPDPPDPPCVNKASCHDIEVYFAEYVSAHMGSFPGYSQSAFDAQFLTIFDFFMQLSMANGLDQTLNVPPQFSDIFPFDIEDMLEYFETRAIADGKCNIGFASNKGPGFFFFAGEYYFNCTPPEDYPTRIITPKPFTPCEDPCYYSDNDILPNVLEWLNQVNGYGVLAKNKVFYYNVARDVSEYKDITTVTVPMEPTIKQFLVENKRPNLHITVKDGATLLNDLYLQFPGYHDRFNWERIKEFTEIHYYYGPTCTGIKDMFLVKATIDLAPKYGTYGVHDMDDDKYYEEIWLRGSLTPTITDDLELVDCPECIKLCNRPILPQIEVKNPCVEALDRVAYYNASQRFSEQNNTVREEFKTNYVSKCSQFFEYLDLEFQEKEYHYTLYTYDQADNLIKTVPPSAVTRLDVSLGWQDDIKDHRANSANPRVAPNHNENLITWYRYNTLNQVIEQHTPDGGTSHFWYDRLGRIVLSQNAKQATSDLYSYSLYDAKGRAYESGELTYASAFGHDDAADDSWVNTNVIANTAKTQITHAVYDDGSLAITAGLTDANNYVLNRIGSNLYFEEYDATLANYTYATHYSYDIHGNVQELMQHIPELETRFGNGSGFKKTKYAYDLISGNALSIAYQDGESDRFYHHYDYDADNRIIQAQTARKTDIWHQDTRISMPYFGVQTGWDKDIVYQYYRHGPLMRAEIGQNQVQGMDYAYTLHGWLKSINAGFMTAGRDLGKDALYTLGGNPNVYFGSDAMGLELTYYHDANDDTKTDYTGIGLNSGTTHLSDMASSSFETAIYNLYNGNIAAMTASLPVGSQIAATGHYRQLFKPSPMGRAFRYDQLNRIRDVKSYSGLCADITNNLWQSIGGDVDKWRETFAYDADGNIQNANRYAVAGKIDSLVYNYHSVSSKRKSNRLYGVNEISPGGMASYTGDIENMSSFNNTAGTINTANNYGYDEIGNLIRDDAEGISDIEWNVQGKIKKITMTSKADIEFAYDASGQRILKRVIPKTGYKMVETWYSRDASGNIMATYSVEQESIGTGMVSQALSASEFHIYGSSRIGMIQENSLQKEIELDITDPEDPEELSTTGWLDLFVSDDVDTISRYVGYKRYELNNHLGNVLTVVTDRKIAVDTLGNNECDYYLPDVFSISDYYAFGMAIQERTMGSPTHTSDNCTSSSTTDSSVIASDNFSTWNSTTRNGWTNTTGGSINPTYVTPTHMRTVCGSTNYTYADYTVVPGKAYKYKLDASAASSAHSFRIELWDNATMIASYTTTLGSTAWTTYTFSFTPSNSNMQIRITKVTTTANNILYIDNIELKEFTTTTTYVCTPVWTYPTQLKGYRFGFNGKEKDDEVKGETMQYNYGFRIYDPRIAKFLSIDPLTYSYPMLTPYQYASNSPLALIDIDGLEGGVPEQVNSFGYYVEQKVQTAVTVLKDVSDKTWQVTKGVSKGVLNVVSNTLPSTETIRVNSEGKRVTADGTVIESDIYSVLGIPNPVNTYKAIQEVYNSGTLEEKAQVTTELGLVAFALARSVKGFTSFSKPAPKVGITAKDMSPQVGTKFQSYSASVTEGKIYINGRAKTHGTFDFVITNEGELRIGTGHYYLSGSAGSVQAAGTIELYNGQIKAITNSSGHYKPTINEAKEFGGLLQKGGINVTGAKLKLYDNNGVLKSTEVIK